MLVKKASIDVPVHFKAVQYGRGQGVSLNRAFPLAQRVMEQERIIPKLLVQTVY